MKRLVSMQKLRLALVAACVALSMGALGEAGSPFPIETIIQPGYKPGQDAKRDEQGIWMEMEEAELELQRSPLLIKDGPIPELVTAAACRVADGYCDDLRIYVVRNPTFNASMAPNGAMIVHTGLLVRAASVDQVAAVLGHELAHFTQSHSLKRLRAAKNRMTAGAIVSLGLGAVGVSGYGLPEILALASVMGFSREQEREADRLGAYFMAEAGYDPMAAARIWRMLEEEEGRASVKRPDGAGFLSSHPQSEQRAEDLAALAGALERGEVAEFDQDPFLHMLGAEYESLMDEQVQLRDHGRLQALLDRHEALGVDAAAIAFYRGESWRVRAGAGDHEKAMQAYQQAIAADASMARAHRELGYLEYKHGDQNVAREHFAQYLALAPEASDRGMVEFYLEDGW